MKKTVAFLLTLVLVCGMASAVFADRSAADVLVMGGDIKLTEDLVLPANIQDVQFAKETTLNLNGHVISSAGSKVQFFIQNSVTIRNGTLRKVELSVENGGEIPELRDVALEYCSVYVHEGGHIGWMRDISMTGGTAEGVPWGQVRIFSNASVDHIKDGKFAQAIIGVSGSVGEIRDCYVDNYNWAVCVEEKGEIEEIVNCVLESANYCGIDARGVIGLMQNTTVIGQCAQSYHAAVLFRTDKPVLPKCVACYFISPRYAGSYEEWDSATLTSKSYGECLLSETQGCKLLKLSPDVKIDAYRDTPNKLGLTVPTAAPVPEPAPEPEFHGDFSNFKTLYYYHDDQFDDVPEDYWGAENIRRAYEMGLLKGPTNVSFAPESNVTLAQAVTMAARLRSIYGTGAETFVQGDTWYQVYVDYAKENGILTEDLEDYEGNATRSQFAAILAASLPDEAFEEINAIADDVIPDVKVNDENAEAIYKLYRAGILTGNDAAGTFDPDSTITRAAAAAIITRMADTELRRPLELE